MILESNTKTVYVYKRWYVENGGRTVNCADREITDWDDLDKCHDVECFTCENAVTSWDELKTEVLDWQKIDDITYFNTHTKTGKRVTMCTSLLKSAFCRVLVRGTVKITSFDTSAHDLIRISSSIVAQNSGKMAYTNIVEETNTITLEIMMKLGLYITITGEIK